jgi:hypothetical protein
MQKRLRGAAQVVEHLPGKCKFLSSNPRTSNENKTNKQQQQQKPKHWIYLAEEYR